VQRAREILKRHPDVRRISGPYPLSALSVAGLVVFQLLIAHWLRDVSWIGVLAAAYFVGAFASHALFSPGSLRSRKPCRSPLTVLTRLREEERFGGRALLGRVDVETGRRVGQEDRPDAEPGAREHDAGQVRQRETAE
jgi:hypothetical protein